MEKHKKIKLSSLCFPYWEKEKRVRDGIALLMRDAPGKSFDRYFEAMLLATKPDICKTFLPEYAQADFGKALHATNYASWKFAKEDKVRYERCKSNIDYHVNSILSGEFFKKERFQKINFKEIAIYLFMALDVMDIEIANQSACLTYLEKKSCQVEE